LPEPLSRRAREIVGVAREVLESEGAEALTMRRLADRLGIRAPSLYKHLPHKAALEVAIIVTGFEEAAAAFEAAAESATDDPGSALAAVVDAYRAFVAANPHVYRLMTERPLPRDELPPGLEARTAAPLVRAVGGAARARAALGFIHGMVMLELNGRLPSDGVTEEAWSAGVAMFQADAPDGVNGQRTLRSVE
jgi:AcrR family transcriptional regulator